MDKAKNNQDPNTESNQALSEKRLSYFMEMLAIKRDTGMTRIYSAISKTDFTEQTDLQPKTHNS